MGTTKLFGIVMFLLLCIVNHSCKNTSNSAFQTEKIESQIWDMFRQNNQISKVSVTTVDSTLLLHINSENELAFMYSRRMILNELILVECVDYSHAYDTVRITYTGRSKQLNSTLFHYSDKYSSEEVLILNKAKSSNKTRFNFFDYIINQVTVEEFYIFSRAYENMYDDSDELSLGLNPYLYQWITALGNYCEGYSQNPASLNKGKAVHEYLRIIASDGHIAPSIVTKFAYFLNQCKIDAMI